MADVGNILDGVRLRRPESAVPLAFWWLSLAGGLTLLIYAIYRRDPVFIMGQGMGIFIYLGNPMLLARSAGENAARR